MHVCLPFNSASVCTLRQHTIQRLAQQSLKKWVHAVKIATIICQQKYWLMDWSSSIKEDTLAIAFDDSDNEMTDFDIDRHPTIVWMGILTSQEVMFFFLRVSKKNKGVYYVKRSNNMSVSSSCGIKQIFLSFTFCLRKIWGLQQSSTLWSSYQSKKLLGQQCWRDPV